MLGWSILYGQDISSTQSIILPTPPSTGFTVNSGQSLTVTSEISITLKAGTLFKSGSTVLLQIGEVDTIPVISFRRATGDYSYDAIDQLASEVKGSQGRYLDYDVSGKVTDIGSFW